MASVGSSTTLAVKAAFIAAMLAVLVLPSMGRCPSLGPEAAPTPAPAPPVPCSDCDQWAAPTPAPTPAIPCSDCDEWAAPTPAPTPAILCNVCDKRCFDACYANVKVMCNENCNVRFYGCSGCWTLYMPKCVNPCKSDCRAAACVSE